MKVLLTGAAGQLSQALIAAKPAGITLIACSRLNWISLTPWPARR